jgi:hypothetical protein
LSFFGAPFVAATKSVVESGFGFMGVIEMAATLAGVEIVAGSAVGPTVRLVGVVVCAVAVAAVGVVALVVAVGDWELAKLGLESGDGLFEGLNAVIGGAELGWQVGVGLC